MPFRVAFYKLIGSILVRVLIDLVRSSLAATRFCQNWRIPGAWIGSAVGCYMLRVTSPMYSSSRGLVAVVRLSIGTQDQCIHSKIIFRLFNILKAIHEAQMPILVLDAVGQVHAVSATRAVAVLQLGIQYRLVGLPLALQVDRRGVFGEALGAPRELA